MLLSRIPNRQECYFYCSECEITKTIPSNSKICGSYKNNIEINKNKIKHFLNDNTLELTGKYTCKDCNGDKHRLLIFNNKQFRICIKCGRIEHGL